MDLAVTHGPVAADTLLVIRAAVERLPLLEVAALLFRIPMLAQAVQVAALVHRVPLVVRQPARVVLALVGQVVLLAALLVAIRTSHG
jgi:hypothetical protein